MYGVFPVTTTIYLVELALLIPLAAFGNDNPDPAAVERGRKAFVASCGFCHGNDATGNRAPDLIRSPLVNRDVSGNLIGPVIKNGRPVNPLTAKFASGPAQLDGEELHRFHDELRALLLLGSAPDENVTLSSTC